MVYAAYTEERDQLDLMVDNATENAGGDMQAAILQLVRRQHRAEAAMELQAPAKKGRRGPRYA